MVKNKKIISLVAAIAMIFSMFSAFTVVNAADKGIELAGALSEDGKTITVEATPVGTEAKLGAWQIDLNVPEGVTLEDIQVTSEVGVTPTKGMVNGRLQVGFLDLSGDGVEFAKLATITINLAAPLSTDYVATLNADSSIADANGEVKVGKGTMAASTVTVNKWVDPNRKPDTVERPGEEVVPDEPEVPEPVLPTKKGIALSASIDKTGTVITVEATPNETESKLGAWQIDLNVPEGVALEDIQVTSEDGVTPTKGMVNGRLQVGFLDLSGDGVEFAKLATITIKLAAPLSTNYVATLNADSSIADANGEVKVGKGTMEASSAVVVPSEEKPAVKKTAALKDYTDKEAASAAKAAEDAQKATYMTVDVKKDGAAATYGSDFIAKYDGKEIKTVEEYKNIIHGYVEDKKVSDVIAKMTFEFYTDGKFAISTTVNAEGEETQLVNPVTDKTVGGGNEPEPPKPSEPKFKANFNPSRPDVGDTVVVTAEISDATDVTITFDEAAFKADTDSANLVSYLGIYPKKDVDNSTEDDTKYLENTWEFKAMAAGELTVPFKVSYTKVSDGTKVTDEVQKATVKISEVDNNNGGNGGSGSGDKDNGNNSGGGAIAPPANGGVNGGLFTSFSDLDQAEWAKQAIMVLSVKGIVSGYGDGTFNPNGNITRAEYCQILIGAIGKTNLAADVLFNDVPSEAWYYHAVSVANSLGIVSGYGDGNFGPNDLITRQDMALMTYKAAQVMNKDVSSVRTMSFADAGSIAEYAATAVQTLADAGIINGVSDTEFAPVANATRAQAAKILYDTFVKVN